MDLCLLKKNDSEKVIKRDLEKINLDSQYNKTTNKTTFDDPSNLIEPHIFFYHVTLKVKSSLIPNSEADFPLIFNVTQLQDQNINSPKDLEDYLSKNSDLVTIALFNTDIIPYSPILGSFIEKNMSKVLDQPLKRRSTIVNRQNVIFEPIGMSKSYPDTLLTSSCKNNNASFLQKCIYILIGFKTCWVFCFNRLIAHSFRASLTFYLCFCFLEAAAFVKDTTVGPFAALFNYFDTKLNPIFNILQNKDYSCGSQISTSMNKSQVVNWDHDLYYYIKDFLLSCECIKCNFNNFPTHYTVAPIYAEKLNTICPDFCQEFITFQTKHIGDVSVDVVCCVLQVFLLVHFII